MPVNLAGALTPYEISSSSLPFLELYPLSGTLTSLYLVLQPPLSGPTPLSLVLQGSTNPLQSPLLLTLTLLNPCSKLQQGAKEAHDAAADGELTELLCGAKVPRANLIASHLKALRANPIPIFGTLCSC